MGILLYKYLSAENTKPIVDRLRNNLSLVFKKLTVFYAFISIYSDFVGCGYAIQHPYGEKHNNRL